MMGFGVMAGTVAASSISALKPDSRPAQRLVARRTSPYAQRNVADLEQGQLEVRLLGGFSASTAGRAVPDDAWRLRRAKSLVKLLALTPERRLHRDQVTEALWPGGDPADNALHQVLYTARRALGGADESGLRLALRDDVVTLAGDDLWVDVEVFERAAAAARAEPSLDAHAAALALYTGELLPEDRYEDWTAARRESLRETHLGLLVELSEIQAAAGDTTAAIETLQRAVVEDPMHEVAHRSLMRLFACSGRQQQALAQFQLLRDTLQRELAAEPDPETRALYRELLAGAHETDAEDEGHAQPAARAPVLPHQLTSFVGRQRELSELHEALNRTRLLTLTGPGGCGKTRLALELAARREADFEHGVGVVELAPVSDPALVADQTVTALGLGVAFVLAVGLVGTREELPVERARLGVRLGCELALQRVAQQLELRERLLLAPRGGEEAHQAAVRDLVHRVLDHSPLERLDGRRGVAGRRLDLRQLHEQPEMRLA